VRVVGYVRESGDPADDRPVFAQQEEIRRWAAEAGHRLVAVCQDARVDGSPSARDGYLSLLGVVGSGGIDAVVVPGIETLSSDQVVQEVLLWDLRTRGVRVLSTRREDLPLIDPGEPGPTRMFIRDVLERVEEHARAIAGPDLTAPAGPTDVIVRLITAGTEPDDEPTDTADD
jgi:hypothetical protein